MQTNQTNTAPSQTLSLKDVIAIVIGIVIGAGIFKFPSLVAMNVTSGETLMLAWLAGGFVSLVGALCYAELATTYSSAGGDYHFLRRGYGDTVSFLFGWARMTVIQPGAIVMISFIIGEEFTRYYPVGPYSSSIYAALIIVFLTVVNMTGIRQGRWTQNLLTSGILLGLLFLIGIGFSAEAALPAVEAAPPAAQTMAGFGMAMIFVLITYSGWNESAYVSAEVKNPGRNIVVSLLAGIGIVTVIYLLINFALYRALGLEQMQKFDAPQRLVELTLGAAYVPIISGILIFAALSTTNATIITGARGNFALGADYKLFRFMGGWSEKSGTPFYALVFQCFIALLLVALGTVTRGGLQTMVDYTSPAFWFFFMLTGISLFVLRFRDKDAVRVFKVPLYPVTPLLFVLACGYMLQSSLAYTGKGALVSVAVLAAAVPVIFISRMVEKR
jgi:amino acid transporter